MKYLEKNLALLKEYSPDVHRRVCDWLAEEKVSEKRYMVVPSKMGDPTLQLVEDGKARFLTSAYNPQQEGDSWAKKVDEKKNYIVYGFGLGYHLQSLMERKPNHILVIEPSMEIFCLALTFRDLEWLFERNLFLLSVAEEEHLIVSRMNYLVHLEHNEFVYTCFNSYNIKFSDQVGKIEKEFNRIVGQYILNVNTQIIFGKQWTDNFFKNLYPTITSPKVKGLFDKFSNIPVVIISAGPSLSKNVHLLKQMKEKALLLCVGTAYKVLYNHGIEPDLIVSFDGSLKNYEIFEGLDTKNIPLVYDPMINYNIIRTYKGPVIPANVSKMFLQWFEHKLDIEVGDVMTGASVANITFDLARKVGGNPIIFVGQDLAYTDGRTHSVGTIYENVVVKEKTRLMETYVEGIHGEKLLSNRSFVVFLLWFESQIALTKDRTFINATEGGARIKGAEHMSLAEVIEKYCHNEHPISDTIQSFLTGGERAEEELAKSCLDLLQKCHEELRAYCKKAKRGLQIVGKLEELFRYPQINQVTIRKNLRMLDKIDANLLSFENGQLLEMIFQPLVLPLLKGSDSKADPNETEEEANARILRMNRNLYDSIKGISEEVLGMLDESIDEFNEKISKLDKEVIRNE